MILENQPLWSIDPISQTLGRRSKLGIDATLPRPGREQLRALSVPAEVRQRVEAVLQGS